MWTWKWRGVTVSGYRVDGRVRAETREALEHALDRYAIALLRARITLLGEWSQRASAVIVAASFRHLAALLDAGLPLRDALRASAREAPTGDLRETMRSWGQWIERGLPLAECAQRSLDQRDLKPLRKPDRALIAAHEQAGKTEQGFRDVAAAMERGQRIRSMIYSAAAYPCGVMVASLALCAGLLIGVIPQFASLYAESSTELPALTAGLIRTSDIAVTAMPYVAFGMGTLGVGGFLLARRRRVRLAVARKLWSTPWIGAFIRDAAYGRFFDTLSRALNAGIPLLQALPIAGDAGSHPRLDEYVERIHHALSGGATVGRALRLLSEDARTAAQLGGIGAEIGRLDTMLEEAGRFHVQRLEQRIARQSARLGPALLLVAGGLTGLVVTALYLPVFQAGSAASGF